MRKEYDVTVGRRRHCDVTTRHSKLCDTTLCNSAGLSGRAI